MIKRSIDIIISFAGLIILFPFLVAIAVWIGLTSKGPAIFVQSRVGKNNKDFLLYKFRTMHLDAHEKRSLTVGKNDNRITKTGFFLRRFKLDELPQLWNVLKGDMSIVGPRPELRKYVEMYTGEQKQVLNIKPGLTDYAVLAFNNEESKILSSNPENFEEIYTNYLLKEKLALNLKYLRVQSLKTDFNIIFKTLIKIIYNKH